jgi:transcriptional repressor NrdR
VDSRESREGEVIRRRRECIQCGKRFTSYEAVEEIPSMVIKKDGNREVFDRDKVLSGLKKACGTRVAQETIEAIADQVGALVAKSPDRELTASEIGEVLMEELKREDHVAFVRFASVYRDFQDTRDFVKEVRSLLRKRTPAKQRKTVRKPA